MSLSKLGNPRKLGLCQVRRLRCDSLHELCIAAGASEACNGLNASRVPINIAAFDCRALRDGALSGVSHMTSFYNTPVCPTYFSGSRTDATHLTGAARTCRRMGRRLWRIQ